MSQFLLTHFRQHGIKDASYGSDHAHSYNPPMWEQCEGLIRQTVPLLKKNFMFESSTLMLFSVNL